MKRSRGLKRLAESFKNAASGIISCIRYEQNFRIHIVAAVFIFIFARVFGLERAEWATLILTVFLVIICEALNTAMEFCVDLVTDEYREYAKLAKDIAAGAVFCSAVAAVVVAAVLFGDIDRILYTIKVFAEFPNVIGAVIFLALGFMFVFFAGDDKNGGGGTPTRGRRR